MRCGRPHARCPRDAHSPCCSLRKNLRGFHVQLALLRNHQDGKDTHLRQVKIFGPRQTQTDLIFPNVTTLEFSQFAVLR